MFFSSPFVCAGWFPNAKAACYCYCHFMLLLEFSEFISIECKTMESERNEKNNPRPWRVIQILMRLDILSCPTACNVYTSSVYNMLCTLFVCFDSVLSCIVQFYLVFRMPESKQNINNVKLITYKQTHTRTLERYIRFTFSFIKLPNRESWTL